jgi:transcriptional regulator with XRE-family HTH domain
MKLNSSGVHIAKELENRKKRHLTVESQIRSGLPLQLRAMREHRNLTQKQLAGMVGMTQNAISRLENTKTIKTSNPTVKTLLRFASVFDVGLLVRFVPFGFYGETSVEIPSYDEEL